MEKAQFESIMNMEQAEWDALPLETRYEFLHTLTSIMDDEVERCEVKILAANMLIDGLCKILGAMGVDRDHPRVGFFVRVAEIWLASERGDDEDATTALILDALNHLGINLLGNTNTRLM